MPRSCMGAIDQQINLTHCYFTHTYISSFDVHANRSMIQSVIQITHNDISMIRCVTWITNICRGHVWELSTDSWILHIGILHTHIFLVLMSTLTDLWYNLSYKSHIHVMYMMIKSNLICVWKSDATTYFSTGLHIRY